MLETDQYVTTTFQQANLLLRNKKWEEALRAYNHLWISSCYLQKLLVWNMNYLIGKAPKDALSTDVLRKAIQLLQQADLRPAAKSLGLNWQVKDIDPAVTVNCVKKQKLPKKKLPTGAFPTDIEGAPCHTLFEAFKASQREGHEHAIAAAERDMPSDLHYSINVLRANAALAGDDRSEWLSSLNRYLQHFAIAPVRLRKGPNLLAQLSSDPLPMVERGPLISVIMPAWNAAETVEFAARSILMQSWRPVELLIVDDASTDGTWGVLQRLAKTDSRVRIFRNVVNVGPYVSKNIALKHATGEFVTGHDSDDWAHPQRLERHVNLLLESKGTIRASVSYMLRMSLEGRFGFITQQNDFTFDGVARKALISCIFHRGDLTERLGFWDAVRFAADSEMISRATALFGNGFVIARQIGMLCLDHEDGLTNHPVHGIRASPNGRLADSRQSYRDVWANWHRENLPEGAFLDFPLKIRRYKAHPDMVVPYESQLRNLRNVEAAA